MTNRKQAYSDKQVSDLLVAYHRTGDSRLRDEVVEHMRPLVQSVARRFSGREPQEDLESEGFVGLIRAVDRFAPDRGARFSTFAMHLVAGQIRHYLRDRGHLIRQPAWLQEVSQRVQRAADALEQQHQRAPTVAEIAAATNLDEEGVEELMIARQAARIVRLEAGTDSDESDYLEVDPEKLRSRDYVTFELPVEDRIVLEGALSRLKELEKKVLYYFFYQDFTQSEIARKLGISCNYAGYVLRNGLKHMREGMPEDQASTLQREDVLDDRSVLDRVTRLYNADYFHNRLGEEISRSQHYEKCVAVCSLELASGASDDTLRRVAGMLRERIRRSDVLARIGANEFALIFPGTGVVTASEVIHRLGEQVQLEVGGTVLAGAASYPDDGRSAGQLLAAARAAALPAVPAALPIKAALVA